MDEEEEEALRLKEGIELALMEAEEEEDDELKMPPVTVIRKQGELLLSCMNLKVIFTALVQFNQ